MISLCIKLCSFFIEYYSIVMYFQGKKDLLALDSTDFGEENGDLRDIDDEARKESLDESASDVDSEEERNR